MRQAHPADGAQVVIFGTVHSDPVCHLALVDELTRLKSDCVAPDFVGVESTGDDFLDYIPQERDAFKNAPPTIAKMAPKLVKQLAATLFFDADAHRKIFDGVETLHLDAGRADYLDGAGNRRPIADSMTGGQGTGWRAWINEFRYENGLEGDRGKETIPRLSAHLRATPAIPNYLLEPSRWTNHEDATRDQVWAERVCRKMDAKPDTFVILIVGHSHGDDKEAGSVRQLLGACGVIVRTCDLSGDDSRWY